MRIDLEDFYNDGFGWVCRHCENELREPEKPVGTLARIMREGEAEGKHPKLSNAALAKWLDREQRTLICPRCGITELADKT